MQGGKIGKITHDHSLWASARSGELKEREAMRHPRRNEVFRDVGSEAPFARRSGFSLKC